MNVMNNRGQTLMELVIGVGLVAVIVGAVAILTVSSLRNTQFSKNQAQATQLAQQNMEKVRTIKNSNFGVCLENELSSGICSTWEQIWTTNFGTMSAGCTTGCTFELKNSCTVAGGEVKPLCLSYKAAKTTIGGNFTYQVIVENETVGEKKVTSNVFWTDISGEHSSQLVTVLGKR